MNIRYVEKDEYDLIVKRIDDARDLRKQAKNPKLTLAKKLELIRKAKAIEALNYRD